MARCTECFHYSVCAKEGRRVQIDSHTWDDYCQLYDVERFCSSYIATADVVPKSEVAWDIFNEIYEALHDRIMARHVIMSTRYAPDEKMLCDECVFIRDHILKPIEKKYTEEHK